MDLIASGVSLGFLYTTLKVLGKIFAVSSLPGRVTTLLKSLDSDSFSVKVKPRSLEIVLW